jgi:hypothetical protein
MQVLLAANQSKKMPVQFGTFARLKDVGEDAD